MSVADVFAVAKNEEANAATKGYSGMTNRELTNQYYKELGKIGDPTIYMDQKTKFDTQEIQTGVSYMNKAAMALQAGDRQAAKDFASNAFVRLGSENDYNMRIVDGPRGSLVGEYVDPGTGETLSQLPMTADSLSQMALRMADPEALLRLRETERNNRVREGQSATEVAANVKLRAAQTQGALTAAVLDADKRVSERLLQQKRGLEVEGLQIDNAGKRIDFDAKTNELSDGAVEFIQTTLKGAQDYNIAGQGDLAEPGSGGVDNPLYNADGTVDGGALQTGTRVAEILASGSRQKGVPSRSANAIGAAVLNAVYQPDSEIRMGEKGAYINGTLYNIKPEDQAEFINMIEGVKTGLYMKAGMSREDTQLLLGGTANDQRWFRKPDDLEKIKAKIAEEEAKQVEAGAGAGAEPVGQQPEAIPVSDPSDDILSPGSAAPVIPPRGSNRASRRKAPANGPSVGEWWDYFWEQANKPRGLYATAGGQRTPSTNAPAAAPTPATALPPDGSVSAGTPDINPMTGEPRIQLPRGPGLAR